AVLAGFAMLLHQQTRQTELLVCSPVAGRHRSRTKGIVGYFNNVLPIRIDLSGDPSYLALLERISRAAKEAYENQDVPLQYIAALPSLALTPLTRCLFSLQNTHSLAIKLPGITSTYEDVANRAANFDLSVFIEDKDNELIGIIDY